MADCARTLCGAIMCAVDGTHAHLLIPILASTQPSHVLCYTRTYMHFWEVVMTSLKQCDITIVETPLHFFEAGIGFQTNAGQMEACSIPELGLAMVCVRMTQ